MSADTDIQQRRLSRDRDNAIAAIHGLLTHGTHLSEKNQNLIKGIIDKSDDRAYKAGARVALRIILNSSNIGRLHWDDLDSLESVTDHSDNPARQILAYLYSMKAANQELGRTQHKSYSYLDEKSLSEASAFLLKKLVRQRSNYSTPVTHTLFEAKILGLTNRKQAAELFARARLEDTKFMEAYEIERGANTYYSEDDLGTVSSSDYAQAEEDLLKALDKRSSEFKNPKINLVWSVDPRFLRIHSAHWLNLAPFMLDRGFGMIIFVVGDPEETNKTIDEARVLVRRLFEFRNIGNADRFVESICFVPVPLPVAVQNAKTYYACARYVLGHSVISATKTPMMILDIDMTVKDYMDQFVDHAIKFDFACPASTGISSFYPWRRYMGNTVFFNNTEHAQKMLLDIRAYVHRGLSERLSWTLDQNALSYAVERAKAAGANIYDFSSRPRPLGQDFIRNIFERNMESSEEDQDPVSETE